MKAFLHEGMNKDIENTVHQRREDRAPMMPTATKEIEPWKAVAVDLMGPAEVLNGRVLLTVIDLYSQYLEWNVLFSELVSQLRLLCTCIQFL